MNKSQAKNRSKGKNGGTKTSNSNNPLVESIQQFINAVAERFSQAGLTYKGDITFEVNNEGASIDIPYYFEYLEKGVNGTKKNYGSPYSRKDKMPPLSIVREWMAEEGIPIKDGSDFAIQKSMQENGLRPRLTWTDLYEVLQQNLQDNYIKDIINQLEN